MGQVSFVHIPSVGMEWVGLEANSATVTTGVGSTEGTHIVYIDFHNQVDIQGGQRRHDPCPQRQCRNAGR
jgi:hypothetical protein